MKTNKQQGPARSTGPLPKVIEVVTVRILDMINGNTMVVWMTNDGKIHQEVFEDKAAAKDRYETIRNKEV